MSPEKLDTQIINGYRLTKPFTTSNAGMCQWTFAQKGGRDYFIKQLLFPKYPTAAAQKNLSESMIRAMIAEATDFYNRRRQFYEKLYECRTGNVVAVLDFFREKEFYYLITERVIGNFLSIEDIAALSEEKKRTFFKAVLYSIVQLQDRGIVHSDLKPENILVRQTAAGFCTAKLIDFDSGYFESEIPDEIIGDQRYLSPEALLRNDEQDVPVTVRSDMFAIGLLFHQYWCGEMPGFDRSEFDSAAEALLNDAELSIDPSIPEDVRSLIVSMLDRDAEKRPLAREAWELLSGRELEPAPEPEKTPEPAEPEKSGSAPENDRAALWFRLPDDEDL